ncbi:hypothetical protein [Nocardia sp. CNY236]|uniref:hypothetical protein n=1 Tax=Nocardia sp. CNY236 TaxID=1169152 RepID=UPI000400D501|nr:hypothetical protein [Nocardia sp. CNY236]
MTTKKAPVKRAVPARPAGVTQPQDHLAPQDGAEATSAAQREAEGIETVLCEFGGMTFEVPADPDDWPTVVHQAFARNAHIDAIEHLLGPQQWARFNHRFPKKRQFVEFSNLLAELLGFGTAGN